MIIVHHLEHSRSQRILWLLEELGLEYEVKSYKRDKKTNLAPLALKAVHPLGKSPVITDGSLTIAETAVIIDYIIQTYGQGRLLPKAGPESERSYRYWMHYAEGSAMQPLLLKLVCDNIALKSPWIIRSIARAIAERIRATLVTSQLEDHITYWENALARTGWFAGEHMTAADIMMSFPLEAAATRAGAGSRPNIKAFLETIHALPAYKAALARGGAYAYA